MTEREELIEEVGDFLLYFSGEEWPPALTVSEHARVHVEGSGYWLWHADDPRRRAMGGSIINRDGLQVHIADLLRQTLAVDDPRWCATIPKPFFHAALIGLDEGGVLGREAREDTGEKR